MPARADVRAETMRRLGSFQTVTVSLDPDVTDATAQRKVITSDQYNIDRTSTHLGQANLWVGRYNEGNKVRSTSYTALAKAVLVEPTTSHYTLKIYGYGTTSSITPTSGNAAAIQTSIRAVSTALANVTVTGSASPYTIASLPSASVTIELVRATPSDTTGSVTQGLSSLEAVRPWSTGLPYGTTVEILTKYPAHDEAGLVGMNNLINQALNRLWFVDLLHFTSTDAEQLQTTYSLDSYPWLKTRPQIVRAYAPTQWRHLFSFTVPGVAFTLTLDVGFASTITTSSITSSATAAVIQTVLQSLLGSNNVNGTVTVTSSGSTRLVEISYAMYADMALTVSNGATVTTTHDWIEALRFTDGYRLKFNGEQLLLEWDWPWQRGQTWFLEVYRPSVTWTCPQTDYQTQGSTWASSTTGLAHDMDQCATDTNEVASVAHYLACRQLELYGPQQEKVHWKDERMRAAMIAAQVKSLDLPSSNEPGFRDEGLSANRFAVDKGIFSGGAGW